MNYEPYNFDSFKKLVSYAYMLGGYSGEKNIFTLKCNGEFEGYSLRATEAWELQFILTSEEIKLDNHTIPALNLKGDSVKKVCDEALDILIKSTLS